MNKKKIDTYIYMHGEQTVSPVYELLGVFGSLEEILGVK